MMSTTLSKNYQGAISADEPCTMPLIEAYGEILDPNDDIQFQEAAEIIKNSETKMELAENAYIWGHIKGRKNQKSIHIPVINIPMLSDDRWNELAARCRESGAIL